MNPGATHYNLAVETLLEPGLTINSTIIGQVQGQRNVFHTDFSYFIGAALLELVCIAFVLPTYWGFWRLGRAVSLSPLEIAKVSRKRTGVLHLRKLNWTPTQSNV